MDAAVQNASNRCHLPLSFTSWGVFPSPQIGFDNGDFRLSTLCPNFRICWAIACRKELRAVGTGEGRTEFGGHGSSRIIQMGS